MEKGEVSVPNEVFTQEELRSLWDKYLAVSNGEGNVTDHSVETLKYAAEFVGTMKMNPDIEFYFLKIINCRDQGILVGLTSGSGQYDCTIKVESDGELQGYFRYNNADFSSTLNSKEVFEVFDGLLICDDKEDE